MENDNYKTCLEKAYKYVYCNGKCEHYDECKKGLKCSPEYGHTFYQAKYGKSYGCAKPRVLFVGKESTDNSGNLSGCNFIEPADVSNVDAHNTHYFGTIFTAAILLRGIVPKVSGKAVTQNDVKGYADLRHEFCLTNYYKCAFKNSADNHGVETSRYMKQNCYKILLKEIDALRPDIIVIQGKFTSDSFWKELESEGKCEILDQSKDEKIGVEKCYYEDSTPFYVVWGYHPSAWQWNQRREEYIHKLNIAKELI